MSPDAKRPKLQKPFDNSLLFIVLSLLGFGLMMIYSVSSYEASLRYGNAAYYLRSQLFATVLGLILMMVVAFVPYQFWRRFSLPAFIISHVVILLVLTPIGIERNFARRWIEIFGISLQVAEVAKLGMILFLAALISNIGAKKLKSTRGFLFVLATPIPICLMIWRITTNLSSAIIIAAIAILMLFVASPEYKRFIALAAVVTVVVAVIVLVIVNTSDQEGMGFRSERILAWLDPEAYSSDTGFQTVQALYAIGSGGIFGKGLGQSMQKLGFIPEAQNDMIFSIICEELGFVGALAIMSLFIILIWRLLSIARDTKDLFGALLVVGVLVHIAVQVILNIAVVTNTIPNTGISLPFISYGGSSVMFLLIEIGLVLSVARESKL